VYKNVNELDVQVLSYCYRILDDNEFGGPIPQEFGNLSALTYLSLSGNILAGSIPTSLGKLTKLEYLYFQNFLELYRF